jgi:hypothetical protein
VTYPSSGSSNAWGYFAPQSTYEYPGSGGTPPSTGETDPPDAPDATSETANDFTGSWPYLNSEMPAQFYTSNMVSASRDGVAFGSGDEPSPGLNVSETTPNAPTGAAYESQGAVAISNTLVISESFAGVPASAIQVFNFGATGNV